MIRNRGQKYAKRWLLATFSHSWVENILFQAFNPNLDLLFVVESAHQQRLVAIGYQIIVQALHNGFGAFFDVDDAVVVIDCDDLSAHGIALFVFADVGVERAPGAYVAPAEISGNGVGVGRLLHHAIVDADVGAVGEVVVDEVLLFGRTEVVDAFVEDVLDVGQIGLDGVHDAVQGPDEDA